MTEETSLAIAEAEKPIQTGRALQDLLTNREDRLQAALEGTHISPQRFIAGVVQAIAKKPDLLACTRESVLLACLEAAQLGLEPTGLLNQAWLVAYKNQARLMIGYAGLITLLDRTGAYDFIEARLVYTNDEFEYQLGSDPWIRHVPAASGDRGPVGHKMAGGYWVAWKRGSSRPQFGVMSYADMEKRRRVSRRAEQDMWRDWPEEMYLKTILRWGTKVMPLTPIVQRALAYEQQTDQLEDTPEARGRQPRSDTPRDRLLAHLEGESSEGVESEAAPGQTDAGLIPSDDPNLPDVKVQEETQGADSTNKA